MPQVPAIPAAPIEHREQVLEFLARAREGPLETLEPLLPLLMQVDGNPLTLNDHFYFSPLYRTRLPRQRILKTARQQGKSTYAGSFGVALCATIPRFTQLFITPLFEQVRRFSVNAVEPLIDESPTKALLIDRKCTDSVLQRTFANKSMMLFSYAHLTAARVRGISRVWRLSFDEWQDMYTDNVSVIMETTSAAPPPWGIVDYTGTPKGLDNPVEEIWSQSSQAEWVIRCPHAGCRKWNFAAAEYDLLGMLGEFRDDICRERPGTVCAKCRKPIDPATGVWLHRYPERRWELQGFHVSQPIAPLHYANPEKWATLLAKQRGRGNYTQNRFWNECLGESLDSGSKLVTRSDLVAASVLPWENNPDEVSSFIIAKKPKYQSRVLGIDWGGGGGEMIQGRSEAARRQRISFTSIAYLGMRYDGRVDCLWGKQLKTPNDHLREAGEIMEIVRKLNPDYLAHDFTGAGSVRETVLTMCGYPREKIRGIAYAHAPSGEIMGYIPADEEGDTRPHYVVDKTRTLLTTIAAIKTGLLRFFKYDYKSTDDPGLIADFLALTEEKVQRDSGTDLYVIRRLLALPDDFAHAVNLGCCALWHRHGWPDFASRVHPGPDSLPPGRWDS